MDPTGKLTNDDFYDIVRNCLNLTPDVVVDLNSVDVTVLPNSGFMGDYMKINIIASCPTRREVKAFAKVMPRDVPERRKYVLSMGAYQKETRVYFEIFPLLASISPCWWACSCFLSKPDLIALTDLSEEGFQLQKITPLDYSHCVTVLRAMADMHASSFALEKKLGKRLDQEFPGLFEENLYAQAEGHAGRNWFIAGLRTVLSLVDNLPNKEWDKMKIKELLPTEWWKMYKLLETSDTYRNVFCHGDLWRNNIMFKYNEGESDPIDVRFVDFQMVRYTPPAHDVVFFLYLATMRDFRTKNWDSLLSVYYDELSLKLKNKGLKIEEELPRNEFDASAESQRDMGRIAAAICHQLCLMPLKYIQPLMTSLESFKKVFQVDRSEEVVFCYQKDETYRTRLIDALEELIECTVLKIKTC